MRNYKISGIILSRRNYGESDKILTVFSQEHGKISILAKGVRRINSRRAPHLELFNQVELMLHQTNKVGLEIVTESKIINNFSKLRLNLKLVGFTFYICEVLEKITPENVPHENIYLAIKDLFANLSNFEKPEAYVKEFVIHLVWELGFLPHGQYPKEGVTSFIESIAEKRINSKKFLDKI